MKRKKSRGKKIAILAFVILFAAAMVIVYNYYQKVYQSVTTFKGEQYFYVHSNWSMDELKNGLEKQNIIKDIPSFSWVAEKKSFTQPKAGRYLIKSGMNNNELINLLRSGEQQPLKVTFNSVRTKNQLAGKIAEQLELDSVQLLSMLKSDAVASKYGFNTENFISMFIPNTYEFYWNTNSEAFVQRMAKEYKRFWTAERKAKASSLGLSQSEVSTLASIVQAEQMAYPDERPKVAGLYINRLKIGMPLQSDPTLIFSIGDFSIKRVLDKHKSVDSPYNTYRHKGLPPGPIYLSSPNAIDAVLDYEKHAYLYMCAKADFSGYHYFSKTRSQHNTHARAYQRELNRRKIMR